MNFGMRGIPRMLLTAALCLPLLAGCAASLEEGLPSRGEPEVNSQWNTSLEISPETSAEPPSEEPAEEPSSPEEESSLPAPILPTPQPTPLPGDIPGEMPQGPVDLPTDPQPAYFTFHLVITDSRGDPIPEAYVTAGLISGMADEEGLFTFHTMEAAFPLHVVAEGYVPFYEELSPQDGETLTVVLEQGSALRELINEAPLRPYTFHNDELNKTVDALFAELFLPGMDTYDKVKACYDWLVKNTVYKRPGHTGSGHWDCALQAFQDNKGTCDCYSSAFAAMMRRIGLESYVVEGITSANSGGMTGHVWTVMVLDGKTYVFDPQVEDAIANRTSSKEIEYVRFGLPEPNGKYKYNGRSRARQMEKFDLFLEENGYFE